MSAGDGGFGCGLLVAGFDERGFVGRGDHGRIFTEGISLAGRCWDAVGLGGDVVGSNQHDSFLAVVYPHRVQCLFAGHAGAASVVRLVEFPLAIDVPGVATLNSPLANFVPGW